MSSSPSQAERDAKRVLQVMLGLPPPATDLIMSTVFKPHSSALASSTMSASPSSKPQGGSPSGTPKYSLRRVDSGPLGDFALTPLSCSRSHNAAVEDFKRASFHMAEAPAAGGRSAGGSR